VIEGAATASAVENSGNLTESMTVRKRGPETPALSSMETLYNTIDEADEAAIKFKVEGLVINAMPYYWDPTSTGIHYQFMSTDYFNNLNL
jgi:hypothetical protein